MGRVRLVVGLSAITRSSSYLWLVVAPASYVMQHRCEQAASRSARVLSELAELPILIRRPARAVGAYILNC